MKKPPFPLFNLTSPRSNSDFILMSMADSTREAFTRYVANAEFNEAAIFFTDGSFLQFEHKGRDKRWARPSTDETTAGQVCRALRQFRLNARHLQLYFEDGSDVEFFAPQLG